MQCIHSAHGLRELSYDQVSPTQIMVAWPQQVDIVTAFNILSDRLDVFYGEFFTSLVSLRLLSHLSVQTNKGFG